MKVRELEQLTSYVPETYDVKFIFVDKEIEVDVTIISEVEGKSEIRFVLKDV
jgi:uncharacterized protein YueI